MDVPARADEAPELRWLALGIFACFAAGAASGPHPYDVGELASAAAQLGGSHPPGQPLHALLGHAAMLLVPVGTIAFRLSLLSSAGAALAAWAAGRVTLALVTRVDVTTRGVAMCVALAIATMPAVVRNAMRPEVYTCALACVMLAAWALVGRTRHRGPGLRVAALLAGLAFALHPPHGIVVAAIGLVSCALRRPSRAEIVASIGIGLASLVVLAYLPTRAAAGAPMWGEPTTASGLYAYLTGAAYHRNLGAGEAGPAMQLVSALRYLAFEGGGFAVLALPFAVARRTQLAAWAFACAAIAAALLQPLEERNPDNVAYFAPALALVLVAAGASFAELHPRAMIAAPFLVLTTILPSLAGGHFASAELPALETMAFETIDAPAPRALLVTRTDFVAGAAMMSRDVDGLRPDLALFVEGLATSSWHWRSLRGHPLFDGRPMRTATEDPRVAFVEGAVRTARGHVEVDVEESSTLDGRGVVRGPLLVALPSAGATGVDDRSMAERTWPAIVSTLAWAPPGDHEAGAQIVRNVVRARSERLFARRAGDRATRELRAATSEPLDGLDAIGVGPLPSALAPLVRDPRSFLCAREDLVRQAASLIAAGDHPLEATAVLEAQAARGDDRALLQLAWIQLGSGLVAAARTSLDAYRAAHDDPDVEVDRLEEALRER